MATYFGVVLGLACSMCVSLYPLYEKVRWAGVTGVVEVVEQEVDCMIRQVVFLVVGGFEQLPLLAQSTRRKIIHRTEFRKELGVKLRRNRRAKRSS